MHVEYSLYPIPTPRGKDENTPYWSARIKTAGTKDTDDFCRIISDCTSFSPSDIKGVLDAISEWTGAWLQEGYHVRLEGIGTLSLSLRSENRPDDKGKPAPSTRIDGINFLPASGLRNRLKETQLKLVKRPEKETFDTAERKQRILDYVARRHGISSSSCALLNHSSRQKAVEDLKALTDEGLLLKIGKGKMVMYIRSYE